MISAELAVTGTPDSLLFAHTAAGWRSPVLGLAAAG